MSHDKDPGVGIDLSLLGALVGKLLWLGLPASEFVIAGSAPLLVCGVLDSVTDIDIVARGIAWERAQNLGAATAAPSGHGHMVRIFGGQVEIFDTWLPGPWTTDTLIDEARQFSGINFTSLETTRQWKRGIDRQKDRAHLALLDRNGRRDPDSRRIMSRPVRRSPRKE